MSARGDLNRSKPCSSVARVTATTVNRPVHDSLLIGGDLRTAGPLIRRHPDKLAGAIAAHLRR